MHIQKAFCAAITLLALLVGTVAGFTAPAFAQSMKNSISGNQIPFGKLDGIGKWKKDKSQQERHYTYVVTLECEEGPPTQLVYSLTGDPGTYLENWCGGYLHGNLTYVSSDPVSIGGTTLNGYRYNGTDESGDWSYFFGSDDLTGQNGFVVAIGGGHYGAEDPQFFAAYLATRSQP